MYSDLIFTCITC